MSSYTHIHFAIDEYGDRIEIDNAIGAIKGTKFFCEICGNTVFPVRGTNQVSHFRHAKNKSCIKGWSEDDNNGYHRTVQKYLTDVLPDSQMEQLFNGEFKAFKADVFINRPFGKYKGVVIEVQKSPMRRWILRDEKIPEMARRSDFKARNEFYTSQGYLVIWIFLRVKEYINGRIESYEDHGSIVLQEQTKSLLSDFFPQNEPDVMVFFQRNYVSGEELFSGKTILDHVVYHELTENAKGEFSFSNWIVSKSIRNADDLISWLQGAEKSFAYEPITEFHPISRDLWEPYSKNDKDRTPKVLDEELLALVDDVRTTDDLEKISEYASHPLAFIRKELLNNENVIDRKDHGRIISESVVSTVIEKASMYTLHYICENKMLTESLFQQILQKAKDYKGKGFSALYELEYALVQRCVAIYPPGDIRRDEALSFLAGSENQNVQLLVAEQTDLPPAARVMLGHSKLNDIRSKVSTNDVEEVAFYLGCDEKTREKYFESVPLIGKTHSIPEWFTLFPSIVEIHVSNINRVSGNPYSWTITRSDFENGMARYRYRPLTISSSQYQIYYWDDPKAEWKLDKVKYTESTPQI